jgi:hypothetical protein
MSLSSSPSPLPKYPFLIADAAFLAFAWFIADSSRHPLDSPAVFGIVVCGLGAAVCGVIPFLVDYSRRQEAMLDERQRSLEALAQTVATAAEQVGIAANGLNQIVEAAEKNLFEAKRLPQRLSEQVAEMEAKLSAAREDDRDELERELATLRSSESERLEATAQKIARAASDWAKAESFGLRHVVAARTFIAELEQKTATLRSVLGGARAPNALAESSSPSEAPTAFPTPEPKRKRVAKPAPAEAPAALSEPTPAEPVPPGATPAESSAAAEPAVAPAAESEREPDSEPSASVAVETEPEPDAEDMEEARAEPEVEAESVVVPARPPPFAKATGGREPALHPDHLFDPDEVSPVIKRTGDGTTRLMVTAYIGIGNRIFIRGEGPGLSWDEGVPLEFVSIGKWRWQTLTAPETVRFKLYKNDREECRSLKTDSIEPGHLQEVTASF